MSDKGNGRSVGCEKGREAVACSGVRIGVERAERRIDVSGGRCPGGGGGAGRGVRSAEPPGRMRGAVGMDATDQGGEEEV